MGGAVEVGGNITSLTNFAAEFNIWVDPVAAQQVLDSGVSVSIIPLDATNSVPINPAALDVYARSATRSSELLQGFYDANPLRGGVFHWDDLAAATLVDPSLVEFEEMPMVVTTDRQSNELGRTTRVAPGNGVAAKVAVSADRDRFERLMFETISGTNATTRDWLPDATVTFDGEVCAYDGPDPPPPELEFEVVNKSANPGSGVIFGVYEPGTTLQEAADFAASGSNRPPPWFQLISVAPMPTRTSSIWIVSDLPSDVTLLCGVTAPDAQELAGVRLPN